jgi:hypothetical protein
MIGPLATAEMVAREEVVAAEEKGPLTAPRPVVEAVEEKKKGPEAFPLERCAALTASIACRPNEEACILEEHGLSASEWASIKNYWHQSIRKAVQEGRTELFVVYDKTYVEQLERERGPISPMDYAKVMVAVERGTREPVAVSLRLPPSSTIRIERVWLRRIALDARLRAKVEEALSKVRAGHTA